MKRRQFAAIITGLFFILIIAWYLTLNNWMPQSFLTPIGQVLILIGLVSTGIFVVTELNGN